MFELTEAHLRGMFQLANFEFPTDEMLFFGLRGCSPVATQGVFGASHSLIEKGTDFRHQRCTIGQWHPEQGFAVYAGSTVPRLTGVAARVGNNGNGVNMMATCYLTDLPGTSDHRYQKGDHGLSPPSRAHRAFRNPNNLPIWRTGDDTDYEGDDRLVYEQAFDNLHCSRHMDHLIPGYSSLGCQVVAGSPGGSTSNPGGEKGPWKDFIGAAYALEQRRFRYALFNEGEALRTAALGVEGRTQSIRFGSTGDLARYVQEGLERAGHDIGAAGADGVIGFRTLLAIRDVQLAAFGPSGVDLVVGPATAAEIGLSWPGTSGTDPLVAPVAPGGPVQPDDPEAPDDLGPVDFDPDEGTGDDETEIDGFEVPIHREVRDNGKFRWVFTDPVDGTRRYVGGESQMKGSRFKGLSRGIGFRTENAPVYSHSQWKSAFGHWAALIEPTGLGESKNSFSCLNSYDRAAFTFGFFQFAAHTPDDNLILLFRKLLALPDAPRYFPDLTLINGRVHQVTATGAKSLEGAKRRRDRNDRKGNQGAFMEYLNSDMTQVDDTELRVASRLIHWACHNPDHQFAQVELAVETARKKVARIARKVADKGATLDNRPMPQVAMAMDIVHQGRAGSTTYSQIAKALNKSDPVKALRKVGRTSVYAGRIDLVADRAERLLGTGVLGELRYRRSDNDFS